MSAPTRTARLHIPEEPPDIAEMRDNFATLYTKGVERLAEMQKRSVDIAMQHNQETIALWKQLAEKFPWGLRPQVLDQAATTLEQMAESQKTAIDLIVEQTHATARLVKERAASWKKSSDAMLAFAQESFDRTSQLRPGSQAV